MAAPHMLIPSEELLLQNIDKKEDKVNDNEKITPKQALQGGP